MRNLIIILGVAIASFGLNASAETGMGSDPYCPNAMEISGGNGTGTATASNRMEASYNACSAARNDFLSEVNQLCTTYCALEDCIPRDEIFDFGWCESSCTVQSGMGNLWTCNADFHPDDPDPWCSCVRQD